MQTQIRGTINQVLDIRLEPGERIFSETGSMGWITPNIDLQTKLPGGIFGGLSRIFSGEDFFVNYFTAKEYPGIVSFCMEFPGKILEFTLNESQSIICQKDAFMVAQDSVKVQLEFKTNLGVGFFGGEGFFLQRITGPGKAWLEFPGEVIEYNLAAGQSLNVDPGYLAAFEPTVTYDIRRVKGIANMFFGGEGIFLAYLVGPGKVWLETMPISNLVDKISKNLKKRNIFNLRNILDLKNFM